MKDNKDYGNLSKAIGIHILNFTSIPNVKKWVKLGCCAHRGFWVSLILYSQITLQNLFSGVLKGRLKAFSLLFCVGGIVVAWSHLTATFQS